MKPYWLKSQQIEVPCRKCIADRIAYSREWTVRLMHELDDWKDKGAGFVTLTYDDDHLPRNASISKGSLQSFFKRFREEIGTGLPIKYFACGEYGDPKKTFRPHYHAIVFGHSRKDCIYDPVCNRYLSPDILAAWQYGYHEVDTVTYDSCRYVTDYIMKKYNGDKAKEYYGDRTVPFRLSSNGIGLNYLNRNWRQMLENKGFTMRGVPMSLPRYYVKKLKERYEAEKERLAKQGEAMSDESDIIPLFEAYTSYVVEKALEMQAKEKTACEKSNYVVNLLKGVKVDGDVIKAMTYAALHDEEDLELSRYSVQNASEQLCYWKQNQNTAREQKLEARTALKSATL